MHACIVTFRILFLKNVLQIIDLVTISFGVWISILVILVKKGQKTHFKIQMLKNNNKNAIETLFKPFLASNRVLEALSYIFGKNNFFGGLIGSQKGAKNAIFFQGCSSTPYYFI